MLLLQYPDVAMPAERRRRRTGCSATRRFTWRCCSAPSPSLFGTRHLDATERHEGMVAAIAFESLVKLLAFLAVGVFVTFAMYDGFADLFEPATAQPRLHAAASRSAAAERQLRHVGVAHLPVDAGDPVPAAPVPDQRGGERQRAPCR